MRVGVAVGGNQTIVGVRVTVAGGGVGVSSMGAEEVARQPDSVPKDRIARRSAPSERRDSG
jgi:hypothetical protein